MTMVFCCDIVAQFLTYDFGFYQLLNYDVFISEQDIIIRDHLRIFMCINNYCSVKKFEPQ